MAGCSVEYDAQCDDTAKRKCVICRRWTCNSCSVFKDLPRKLDACICMGCIEEAERYETYADLYALAQANMFESNPNETPFLDDNILGFDAWVGLGPRGGQRQQRDREMAFFRD